MGIAVAMLGRREYQVLSWPLKSARLTQDVGLLGALPFLTLSATKHHPVWTSEGGSTARSKHGL